MRKRTRHLINLCIAILIGLVFWAAWDRVIAPRYYYWKSLKKLGIQESPVVFQTPTFQEFVVERESEFSRSLRPVEFEGYEFTVPPQFELERVKAGNWSAFKDDKDHMITFLMPGKMRGVSEPFAPERLKESTRHTLGRLADYALPLMDHRFEKMGAQSDFEFYRKVYWMTKDQLN